MSDPKLQSLVDDIQNAMQVLTDKSTANDQAQATAQAAVATAAGTLQDKNTAHALGVQYSVEPPPFMSTDSATRKLMPVATGFMNYFPDAIMCVAFVSKVGNDKHNPGEPLHWAKEKSTDEPDAEARHMLDHFRELPPDPGLEPLGELGHLASKAWRALAHLQRACDAVRKDYEAK